MMIDLRPNELIVDSFAGGGGASLGIAWATGRAPDLAINHDPEALAMHAANHPSTRHVREDVWHADLPGLTGGKPVGLLWASPDCKHFSAAKGGVPVEKEIRSLAWVIVRWASQVSPRIIILENVREFADWGPLKNGRPDKAKKGMTFRLFTNRLRGLGYKVERRVLNAADFGAPTSRRRLFVIARRDGEPIVWPEPTHGDPATIEEAPLFDRLKPWRTAAEIIDWELPVRSTARRKRPLSPKTKRRLAVGGERFGSTWLLKYFGTAIGQPVDAPLGTVTTKARYGLVDDGGFRMLTPRELARAQGFPDTYELTGTKTSQIAKIGNSVCPHVAAAIAREQLQPVTVS